MSRPQSPALKLDDGDNEASPLPSSPTSRVILSSSSNNKKTASSIEDDNAQRRINAKLQKSLDELDVTIISDDEYIDDEDSSAEEETAEAARVAAEDGDVLGDLLGPSTTTTATGTAAAAAAADAGVSHLMHMLERKPTLEVEFMRNLTVPDAVPENDNLFETNRNTMPDSPITEGNFALQMRKTGFESWLVNPPPITGDGANKQQQAAVPLLAWRNLSLSTMKSAQCALLKSVSGSLLAGKSTLLLGPPSNLPTLLLQCLHSPSSGAIFDEISTLEQVTMLVSHENDNDHVSTFTVRETLEMAAELEGKHLPVDRVVESLGLSDQACFTVQGLSPSQRRRLTLGCALFSPTRKVLLLDDVTKGLGASESQQIMRIVRSACKVLGFTCLVHIQQPNDMLFDSFDYVQVLSRGGELAFAGHTSDAVDYFEHDDFTRPGGMSSTEYILLCIDMQLEKQTTTAARPGRMFAQSSDGVEWINSVDDALRQASCATKPQPSVRFSLLLQHKLLMVLRSSYTLHRLIVALAFAIVLASLFGELSQDLQSTFARQAFLFSMLMLLFVFASVSSQTYALKQQNKVNVVKLYMANVIGDLPVGIVEALVFSVITYWWVGLNTNKGSLGFCYLFFVLCTVEFVGMALGRVADGLVPAKYRTLLCVAYLSLGALVCGFMPSYRAIPGWWQWVNWLNPVSYAYEALAVTELLAFDAGKQRSTEWFGVPRVPLDQYGVLNTPEKVMGFDFGMLLMFAILLDLTGLLVALYFNSRPLQLQTAAMLGKQDAKTLMQNISQHFFALKMQELMSKDEDGDDEESDEQGFIGNTQQPSPRQWTLSLIDVSLFARKPQNNLKLVPSFLYYYQRAMFALQRLLCGYKIQELGESASAALPAEERIQMTVHRPRGGVDEDAEKRERAWSNKLPAGEDEDVNQDGGGEIQVVDRVGAVFRSGELSCLLGNSSIDELLHYMAFDANKHRAIGEMYLNSSTDTRVWRRAFVGRDEHHFTGITVREAIKYSRVVQSSEVTTNRVLQVLQLDEYSSIAVEMTPLHVQKRVSIAVQLVSKLPRLLFLQDPMWNLDSVGSEVIAAALQRVTREFNLITVCTLLQPSRAVFGRFDRVLLLVNAQVVYHGAVSSFNPFGLNETGGAQNWRNVNVIHRQPSSLQPQQEQQQGVLVAAPTIGDTVLAYFASLGAPPLRQGFNPADHLLIAVDALVDNGVDVADLFTESKEIRDMHQEAAEAIKRDYSVDKVQSVDWPLVLYVKRNALIQLRDPVLFAFRLVWTVSCAIFIGTVFFHLACTFHAALLRVAALFFVVMACALVPLVAGVQPAFQHKSAARAAQLDWRREALGKTLSALPLHALLAVLFYSIVYYALGFQRYAEPTGYFILMVWFAMWMLFTFVDAVVLLAPNIELGVGMANLVTVLSTLLMGFLIPVTHMPAGWRWATWLNMFYYLLQGLAVSEFAGQSFTYELLESPIHLSSECFATFAPYGGPMCTTEAHQQVITEFELLRACASDCRTLACTVQFCSEEIFTLAQLVNAQFDLSCWNGVDFGFKSRMAMFAQAYDATSRSTTQQLAQDLLSKQLVQAAEQEFDVLGAMRDAWGDDHAFDWSLHFASKQTAIVRGDFVLQVFGWSSDVQWWFCVFAICMFILGWEIVKSGGFWLLKK